MAASASELLSVRYFRPHEWVSRTLRSATQDAIACDSNCASSIDRPLSTCARRGFRLNMRRSFGEGFFEAVEIAPGVHLQTLDVTMNSDFRVRLVGERDTLAIGLLTGGPTLVVTEALGRCSVDGSTCYVLSVPEGERVEARYRAGFHYTDVKLRFEHSRFEAAFGLSGQQLPLWPNASGGERKESPGTEWYVRGRSARATVVAKEVGACTFEGDLRFRYLQAKAQELACELVAAFAAPAADAASAARISKRNIEQLLRARDLLGARARDRLALPHVATSVGLSLGRLSQGFKQLFGMTVTDYRRELCLLEARRLLDETQWGVQKISQVAGYSHQSTFATAFKQRFGVSPTEYREIRRFS